jgi:hypothetical protein
MVAIFTVCFNNKEIGAISFISSHKIDVDYIILETTSVIARPFSVSDYRITRPLRMVKQISIKSASRITAPSSVVVTALNLLLMQFQLRRQSPYTKKFSQIGKVFEKIAILFSGAHLKG